MVELDPAEFHAKVHIFLTIEFLLIILRYMPSSRRYHPGDVPPMVM